MEAEPSIDECQCRVLQLMRDATAAGVVKWSEADQDRFDTVSGPIQSYIQFKWPSFNGDASSDRDFVEVEGVGRFMIGTPGYSLALEILGAGLDNWARHLSNVRQQYDRLAQLLSDAIDQRRE